MELGTREFSEADQRAFAFLSNDYNPMHMDRQAARRTQMGAPVVHGMNGALWALELACAHETTSFSGIKVNFSAPIYLGEQVRTLLTKRSDEQLRLQARVGDALATTISVDLGNVADPQVHIASSPPRESTWPQVPIAHTFNELATASGSFAIGGTAEAVTLYPKLCQRIGALRAAGLAALSRLVGMICPGLHSIFSGLSVRLVRSESEIISFTVVETDARFNIVRMLVSGGGIEGEVTAVVRAAPTSQPSSRDIRRRVPANLYRDADVLVVGGSRGLGEVTAKACAAGGARVTITYVRGKDEALAVAREIEMEGGVCEALHLDVQAGDFSKQLAALRRPITHLYYYATGPIAQRRTQFFSADVLASFLQFYASGFASICQTLSASGSNPLVAFYPSSIAVEETPRGWVEYAMAKAAGEVLCREMDMQLPGIRIVQQRLPRILTDQTATSRGGQSADVLDVILPLVDHVQRALSQP